jgi:membrane protein insertase, YidC/Oxa1 family, N-terminal domain
MDRNSAIGLTLIAGLLLVYFTWFSPQPEPPTAQKNVPQPSGNTAPDSLSGRATVPDSVLAQSYGDFSTALQGEERTLTVETEDLRIDFSSRGGTIKSLELRNYQTYDKQPLFLVSPQNNMFSLLAKSNGRDIDLYKLYYTGEQTVNGDTTVITFRAKLANGAEISQSYFIPKKGFEVRYALGGRGIDNLVSTDPLSFEWKNVIRLMEKDLEDTRNHSTVNYFTVDDGFDNISETSHDNENEKLESPVSWVAIKQKFFLSAIVASSPFPSGEVGTYVNQNDPTFVKGANIKLQIARETLNDGKADFKFYFGPNDYQIIGDVAEKFARNVYLGWPPVYWINKFVIFPVFHLLTQVFSNYGLIIVILVILLKLVLFPLSYRSYLSMAKMKVLKPELDEIKERIGEDMAKVQQEQMKLYQQVGVNPISGCVPVLLQMPILFAMFYLFPASIELRQQPFLWAEDLSTYDSLISFSFAIPFLGSHISLFTLLMTLSTLIYTWQNNQISSVQGPMKSMSYIMPVIFFFVLNKFSAGLTFYYLVSNLVTFAQQAVIKRFVDENKIRAIMEENKKRNAAGGAKKSKFMARLEEAMKASEEAKRKAEEERKRRKDNRK